MVIASVQVTERSTGLSFSAARVNTRTVDDVVDLIPVDRFLGALSGPGGAWIGWRTVDGEIMSADDGDWVILDGGELIAVPREWMSEMFELRLPSRRKDGRGR